jgi:phosphomannomutase
VSIPEGGLEGVERIVSGSKPFHSGELVAVHLHGKDQAGADRFSIHQDRTGATNAVLTPNVGAGEVQLLAEKVAEQEARLDGARVGCAVDPDGKLDG